MKRNYAIDWLKGLMILIVVLVHSQTIPVLRHGYIAVDLFFFISGFYLSQSFERNPLTSISYTWNRIKRFYLPYILCFSFSCLLRYKGLASFTDWDSFIDKYAKFASYLTLTEEIGPKLIIEHILDGSWFISVLIIAGFLLYSLLEYNKQLAIKVILPFSCILGYTFFFTVTAEASSWSRIGAMSLPLMRGFCAMSAGILLSDVWKNYHDAIERRSTVVNIAGLLSFLLYIAIMFTREAFDVYLILTIPWIVLAAVIDHSWFNALLDRIHGGLLSKMGQITIYILFAHPPVITIVRWVNENLWEGKLGTPIVLTIELVGTLVATFILFHICHFIERKWLKRVSDK